MPNDDPIATYRTPALLIWPVALFGAVITVPMLDAILTVEAETIGRALNRWILLGAGIALLVSAYAAARVRTNVFEDRVEQVGAFGRRTLHMRDIAGFRDAAIQGHIRLIPERASVRAIRVPKDIMKYADRVTWIDKLIDLEDAERRVLDRSVRSSPRFGATEGDRAAFVRGAEMRVLALTLAAFAAMTWALIWPEPRFLVVTVLVLLPLLGVAVAVHARPIVRVVESGRRIGKLDLFLAIAMPSLILFVVAEQRAIIDRQPVASLLAGAAIAATLGWLDPLLHRRWLTLAILAFIGVCYASGATIEANALLDRAAPARIDRAVHEKQTTGGWFATHRLTLRPWIDNEQEREVTVPRELYEALAPGDRVCIDVYPGALGLRWYEVERCSTSPAAPAQADPA